MAHTRRCWPRREAGVASVATGQLRPPGPKPCCSLCGKGLTWPQGGSLARSWQVTCKALDPPKCLWGPWTRPRSLCRHCDSGATSLTSAGAAHQSALRQSTVPPPHARRHLGAGWGEAPGASPQTMRCVLSPVAAGRDAVACTALLGSPGSWGLVSPELGPGASSFC